MQVVRLILSGQLEPKMAGLLLYALQTASVNLRNMKLEPYIHETVVIDPSSVADNGVDDKLWNACDFEEEEEEARRKTTKITAKQRTTKMKMTRAMRPKTANPCASRLPRQLRETFPSWRRPWNPTLTHRVRKHGARDKRQSAGDNPQPPQSARQAGAPELVVVYVVVGWRRRWHGQGGSYVERVIGNEAAVRIAADFGIGEEGFVSLAIDRGDRDIEAVAGIEAQGSGGDAAAVVGDGDSLAIEVFVDRACGYDEVINTAIRSFEVEVHASHRIATSVEFGWGEWGARQAGGHGGHHLRDARG